jgi:VCBS repeat-containing protein
VSAAGVLASDTDPVPNDSLIVGAVDGQTTNVGQAVAGAYGILTLNADGSYTYSATNNNHALPSDGVGLDTFTYTAQDGAGGIATTTLTA